MPIALEPAAAENAASPDAGSPRWRRAQGWLRDLLFGRPEDQLLALSARSAEGPWLLYLGMIVSLGALAVVAAREGQGDAVQGFVPLASFAAACEIISRGMERRHLLKPWLVALKIGTYQFTVGAAMWAALVASDPAAYALHQTIFLIYVFVVSASGLRDDPRMPLAAGMFGVASYLLVALWVPEIAAVSPLGKASRMLEDFSSSATLAHCTILGFTTLMAAASSLRGQALRRHSLRDGLTGLVNRQVFDACLENEGERARRSGRPLSIAMIDVDHFKQINDTYGHAFGDEVLRRLSAMMRDGFRSTDLVARYGGEEFAVVFIDSDDDRLSERLDALRLRIASTDLRLPGRRTPVRVTVSVGIARWPCDGRDVVTVLSQADRRLYEAKRAGRNRVVSGAVAPASDPGAAPAGA